MRRLFFSLGLLFTFASAALSQTPACTGLCLQQVSCPNGGTTTLTGTVYTPNGVDPLPNVLVYIPNAAVPAFTPGVSCPVAGAAPPGSPLVGTTSAVDGTFTILNVPVGNNIPLVIQTGRWRRQFVVNVTAACGANPVTGINMPANQTQGDIPRFAIATGSADQVECVLRKVGIADSEFTDPSGTGRINLFQATGSPGAVADNATPSANALMNNGAAYPLTNYDVLMLPCEGSNYLKSAQQLNNLIQFANAGGRVYSSHFAYEWMYQNPPFNSVANWIGSSGTLPDGIATVDTSFADGKTLAGFLQETGASTTPGQIAISAVKHDFTSINPPTQSYLTLNSTGNPVMQFVFDTPIGSTNQCGRVLYNEYHVENPPSSPAGKVFPAECSTGPMTPQEKLLEYSLFELTNDGGAATLTPATQDFGAVPVGVTSGAQTFSWTNNSTFPATVTLLTGSGDFSVGPNNCTNVPAGASCAIQVYLTPTALGARTGTLTVGSAAATLTSSLTGTGTPALTVSTSSLSFGSTDVGAHSSQILTVTNQASVPIAVPPLAATGDFTTTSTCGATIPGNGACTVTVIFTPSTTGPRTGTLAPAASVFVYTGVPVALTGNGVDFTLNATTSSGSVIAGLATTLTTVTTPIAGFSAPVTLSCTTSAPATTCSPATQTFVPASATNAVLNISTTSEYTVVGYGGLGTSGWTALVAFATGSLLWFRRRRLGGLLRLSVALALLAAVGASLTGCSGKQPAKNPAYTAPGTYTLTVSATDGFLVHSVTYSLNVTAK